MLGRHDVLHFCPCHLATKFSFKSFGSLLSWRKWVNASHESWKNVSTKALQVFEDSEASHLLQFFLTSISKSLLTWAWVRSFPIISFALRFATRTASCSRWPESLEGSTSRMFFISLMIFYSSQKSSSYFHFIKEMELFFMEFSDQCYKDNKERR